MSGRIDAQRGDERRLDHTIAARTANERSIEERALGRRTPDSFSARWTQRLSSQGADVLTAKQHRPAQQPDPTERADRQASRSRSRRDRGATRRAPATRHLAAEPDTADPPKPPGSGDGRPPDERSHEPRDVPNPTRSTPSSPHAAAARIAQVLERSATVSSLTVTVRDGAFTFTVQIRRAGRGRIELDLLGTPAHQPPPDLSVLCRALDERGVLVVRVRRL